MSDIEKTILGCCFFDYAVHDIVSKISADDFEVETNRIVFNAIETLLQQDAMPDLASVRKIDHRIDSEALLAIVDATPTASNAEFWIDKFLEHAERNRYIKMSRKIVSSADMAIDEMREIINEVTIQKNTQQSEHAGKVLKRAMKQWEEAYNSKGITGIPTGISLIDEELSGLHNTDMVVVAARPAIGKTAVALQLADSACVDSGVPTLFMSLEMENVQLISRHALSRAKVDVSKSRNGKFQESDWPRITRSVGDINASNLYVENCIGCSMDQIMSKAKAAKARHQIGLVVIDYLGLIGGKGSEYERVSEASRKTKTLAAQMQVPIIALHQLNRSNLNGRPTMNELRSSGQIEQDADVIILLHREKKNSVEDCELIIEKNRHGKTGIIEQTWNGPINRIEERRGEYGRANS